MQGQVCLEFLVGLSGASRKHQPTRLNQFTEVNGSSPDVSGLVLLPIFQLESVCDFMFMSACAIECSFVFKHKLANFLVCTIANIRIFIL